VRSVVYKYDDLHHLADALDIASGQALPLPDGSSVRDGEWVLAMFELGGSRRATAAAGRGAIQEDGPALVFERRDWERLRAFATARGESETRLTTAKAFASKPVGEASDEFPIDVADTARSGVHAAGGDIPAGPLPDLASAPPPPRPVSTPPMTEPGTGPHVAVDPLRSTQSWETGTREVAAVAPPQAPTPSTAPSNPETMRPRRVSGAGSSVLIVDDDEDLREVVGAMLDAVGLVVETVGSAEDALEHAREKPIDLMVLDWSLPGMSGIDLCRTIRRDASLAHLPVLFLTAHSATQDMVEAFAAGADDYVVKPFRAAELGARIFGLLRRARLASPKEAH
jgi:CheY-like chemotaxis protein